MKPERQSAIRDLIRSGIPSQDELRLKLAERGFHVTQATLSRDMRELHVSKGPTGYYFPQHEAANSLDVQDVLEDFALEARQAQNLVVLITRTGGASPVAAGIDDEGWPEVVGTIAGDDTVLIICPDVPQATSLRERIEASLA